MAERDQHSSKQTVLTRNQYMPDDSYRLLHCEMCNGAPFAGELLQPKPLARDIGDLLCNSFFRSSGAAFAAGHNVCSRVSLSICLTNFTSQSSGKPQTVQTCESFAVKLLCCKLVRQATACFSRGMTAVPPRAATRGCLGAPPAVSGLASLLQHGGARQPQLRTRHPVQRPAARTGRRMPGEGQLVRPHVQV